ncbi:MAG: helix-turn-helix domain-containing protein [Bacteroidota bacterium]
MARVFFFIPQKTSLFDVTGIFQVFKEATEMGLDYDTIFVSEASHQNMPNGLQLGNLKIYRDYGPTEGDIVIIPGKGERKPDFREWLRGSYDNGATLCGICTGVFTLAYTGLLDGREATTHWKYMDSLREDFPKIEVVVKNIFIKNDRLYTTAGVLAGIDLALHLVEERHGAHISSAISKELVLYRQRSGSEPQLSIYNQGKKHVHDKIHRVQKLISRNLERAYTIPELAEKVFMSPRNLSRIFKKVTGTTIGSYRRKMRIERALTLLSNTSHKVETIANMSGYRSPKQLRLDLQSCGYDHPKQ